MNRLSLDRVTRGHVLLAVGIVAGVVGLSLVVSPGVVPEPLRQLQPSVDGGTVFGVVAGLALGLVLVAAFRVVSRSSAPVDRSPIRDDDPEEPAETPVPTVGSRSVTTYERLLAGFENADRSRRYAAMYGRRASTVRSVPVQIQSVFDELAATAADTHATATGCSAKRASRAVATGSWTEDRIAAAFLASDPEAAPTFTTRERLLAWIAPRYVFASRLDRTLDAIETQADTFLTYSAQSAVESDRPQTADGSGHREVNG